MKLTAILLLAAVVQVSARGTAQMVTYKAENEPLTKVFAAIEKQTGFAVFYRKQDLSDLKKVSVNLQNIDLTEALHRLLADYPLSFNIAENTIFILKKRPVPATVPTRSEVPSFTVDAPPIIGIVRSGGKPIEGASVLLTPRKIGGTTNASGAFVLQNVPAGNYTIEISSIGYTKLQRKITVGNQPLNLDFNLEVALSVEEEVVISTGYSSKKTGEITGAVQRISGDDLRKGLTTSDPVSLLKGRTTGLYISEQSAGDPTSSGGQIFLRGQSSIAGVGVDQVNEFVMPAQVYGPLLVLDGVIMPNQNLKELVTPQEIQDITILKDAAATAIYGSRAAAGVLVVTTKKGRSEKPRLTAELKYGINKPNQGTMRFLNAQELYDVQKRYYTEFYNRNSGSLPQYPTVQDYLNYKLPSETDLANSFDWTKYMFSTSNTKEVNVAASGGNDKTKYYVGGTYYNEESTGMQNGLVRKSFRLNLDSRLTERLKVSLSINGILNNGRRDQDGNITFLYGFLPWANPYDANGNITPTLRYKADGLMQVNDNPLFNRMYNFNKLQSQLFFGSAKLEYRINDWLSFSSTNSGNLNYNKQERYIDVRTYTGGGSVFAPKGYLGTTTDNLTNYLTSNQLNFNKIFNKHTLRALAAMEFGKTNMEDMRVNVNDVRAGYPVISLGRRVGGSYDLSIYGIPSTKAGNIEGGADMKAVFSGFGEVGYTYDDRYSLSASLRTDASSSFGPDKRYGTFYSGGAAWNISNEQFMQSAKWVNNLKLRASYGTSGSQLGDNFLTRTLYDPRFTYAGQGGATISVLGNPDLKWEVTKTLAGGIDFGIFRNITGSVDFYKRRSEDLLQKTTLRPLTGFPTQWQNVASVENSGIEILLNTQNINGKNFQWSTSFNFSYNKNKIISVANDSLVQGWGNASYYLFPGEDINTLKGVKYAGVDPQTGMPLFEKLIFDADGKRTGVEYVNTLAEVDAATDRRQNQAIGSFQPKYYGGLINTFTYKQFSLSVMITYALKYFMHDELAEQNQGANLTDYNQLAFRKNQKQWEKPGDTDANEPWFFYQATTSYWGSSKYMHDASHAALRNVRLSYDLPASVMSKLKMSNCTVFVSGDNLYTLYSKDIVASNPEGPSVGEAQGFGGSSFGIGIPRRYVFGLQLTF